MHLHTLQVSARLAVARDALGKLDAAATADGDARDAAAAEVATAAAAHEQLHEAYDTAGNAANAADAAEAATVEEMTELMIDTAKMKQNLDKNKVSLKKLESERAAMQGSLEEVRLASTCCCCCCCCCCCRCCSIF
jgi:hypothetical protein